MRSTCVRNTRFAILSALAAAMFIQARAKDVSRLVVRWHFSISKGYRFTIHHVESV